MMKNAKSGRNQMFQAVPAENGFRLDEKNGAAPMADEPSE
jgi:hypothetical protein